MKRLTLAICTAVLLSGCFKESAPDFSNIESISVNGDKYTPREYLKKFCAFEGAEHDKNCRAVDVQRVKEQSKIRDIKW